MSSFVGRTINSRYRLESLLGDGGMGAVYRAHDLNLDRQVAIKIMHAHFARQPEFRARLIQEAKTAAQLDHPSVVSIFDFGDSELGLFIAMAYVDGGSLRDHLRRLQRMRKFLPLSQSLQIGAQIADALHYAHQRGIIHRDIKPGNIILKKLSHPPQEQEQPFRALLTDFGLVKLQEGTQMTQSGTTLGTPTYMSPEQCAGQPIDHRTDLYALGVVLYELVTNRLPFTFHSLSEAMAAHQQGIMPAPAHEIRADVPRLIDDLLQKSLAKSPDARFANGAEMAAALRSAMVALEGAPTRVMTREEMDILQQVNEPPPGFELHIETPGHPASVVTLTRPVITIGRNVGNDIVLPTEGVSRHHARLQATLLGWEIVDLGGINGTWLNNHRLRIDAPTPMPPSSRLRIGPYELTLIGPEIMTPEPVLSETMPRLEPTTSPLSPMPTDADAVTLTPHTPGATEPLALYLLNDQVSVEPGHEVEVKVEIVNQGTIDDRVSLRVQGLPSTWVTAPDEFVDLPVGETAQLQVVIRPTRHHTTPTGRQRFRLQVVSQRHPQLQPGATAVLILGSFVAFEARMDNDQVTLPGSVTVSVQNTGNQPIEISLVAHERQGMVRFRGERGRIRLESGQITYVELEMEARRQSLFGGSGEVYPFEIEVVSSAGGRQTLAGEARSGSALPVGVLYGLIGVIIFTCVFVLVTLIINRDRLFGGAATPTADPFAVAATETMIAAEQTLVAATLETTATVDASGDPDQDGLSNDQEVITNTDPNNPDTDGDGLLDGDEVTVIGSSPTNRDTDGDVLGDGEEWNFYGTDPTKADTDGDGIPDGVEITTGSDPLATPVPTITLEPTASPTTPPDQTATPTQTPLPSLTPTATSTPPPAATATATAVIPTSTATATPTALPTNTPSPTAVLITPTTEPTPTGTPMPNPVIACTTTPPIIDGVFQVTEWEDGFLVQFSPEENPTAQVEVYFLRDTQNLYLAFLINDDTSDDSDSLSLYFDTTNNGGDPDTADRFFQVARDGTASIWAGVGSNTDTREWDPNYQSENWTAVIGDVGNDQWLVEVEIQADVEMPALSLDAFGMMVRVLFTGEDLALWPDQAISNSPETWQDVDNVICNDE